MLRKFIAKITASPLSSGMMDTMERFMASVTGLLPRSRRSATVRKIRTRLSLEALEDRFCPAVDIWIGPSGGNWNVAANWSTGAVPTYNDDVQFNGAYSNGDCDFTGSSGSQVCNSLTLTNGYTGTVHFQQEYVANIGSGGIQLDSGDLEQDSGEEIMTTGVFGDAGGNLNVNSAALADLQAGGLNWTNGFETGSNIVLNGMGGQNAVVNMPNKAITFSKNAGINITQGTLNVVDGEFVNKMGSVGLITIGNGTTFERSPGTVQNFLTQLAIDNNGGKFQIQYGTFTITWKDNAGYSYNQTAGTIDLANAVTLQVDQGFYMKAGNFWTDGATASINGGDVTFDGGVISLNHNSEGGSFTGTLNVQKNVFIQGTAEFDAKVDDSNPPKADKISCAGTVTLGGNSTLKAISVNLPAGGKVPKGKTWDILSVGTLKGNFANFNLNFNDGTNGVYKANPANPYTLTS